MAIRYIEGVDMKSLILFISMLPQTVSHLNETRSHKDDFKAIEAIAMANGFKPSKRVIRAIQKASSTFHVNSLELTAIGIIETGLGKYSHIHRNSNGTVDRGIFQINTVNEVVCVEYNLDSPEGSALCAAKLLSQIKTKHNDYLGRYHSKTPTKKAIYLKKVTQVLAQRL